jgi:hypothetical protein
MMPAQQGTLNVVGDSVFEVVSVPVSALRAFDDDHDGRLSDVEVDAHLTALQAEVGARFRLFDGTSAGTQEMVLVRAEPDERDEANGVSGAGSRQVLALLKTRFSAPPIALRLETDLFGVAEGEGQFTLRATRGAEKEVAVVGPAAKGHEFFVEPGHAVPPADGGRWTTRLGFALVLAVALGVYAVAQLRRRGAWFRRALAIAAGRAATTTAARSRD